MFAVICIKKFWQEQKKLTIMGMYSKDSMRARQIGMGQMGNFYCKTFTNFKILEPCESIIFSKN